MESGIAQTNLLKYSNAEDEDYWSVLDEIDRIPFIDGLLIKDEIV